jgi:hypothetical protein
VIKFCFNCPEFLKDHIFLVGIRQVLFMLGYSTIYSIFDVKLKKTCIFLDLSYPYCQNIKYISWHSPFNAGINLAQPLPAGLSGGGLHLLPRGHRPGPPTTLQVFRFLYGVTRCIQNQIEKSEEKENGYS